MSDSISIAVYFTTDLPLHIESHRNNPGLGIFQYPFLMDYIDRLVQDCSNSSALAVELLQSCPKLYM